MITVCDQTIARNCAPTLAGLKTGSMFTAAYADRRTLARELAALNRVLTKYGLRAIVLRFMSRRALIYLYRPEALARDLRAPAASSLLWERGYPVRDPRLCLGKLIRQFRQSDACPHEVGLFLGYPPEDVRGFMEDPHGGYQCAGFWKVYGDRERAECLFARYRQCTRTYCHLLSSGATLEQLISQPQAAAG